MTRITDPVGNKTDFTYDELHRLKTEKDPQLKVRTYGYDAASRLSRITDRRGKVRDFTIDDLDRTTKEEWRDSVGGPVLRTIHYGYDLADRLTSTSDPDAVYGLAYDDAARTINVTNAGTPGVPTVALLYSHNVAWETTSVAATVGGAANYTNEYRYDELGRTKQLKQSGLTVSPKLVTFTYNNLDQFKTITRYSDLAGMQQVAASNYTYDVGGRLTDLVHSRGMTTLAAWHWNYDNANRISFQSGPDGTVNYSYDKDAQLLSANHSLLPDEYYTYDYNGNRTNNGFLMPPVGQANRLQEDAVYAYQYDFEGNRTRRTNKTTGAYEEYTWDHRNRLTRVTSKTAGGTVTRDSQYARDTFDRRIKKVVDLDGSGPGLAETTRHVYDGDHVALAFDGASSLTNRYLHGPVIDQVLADELIGTGNRWALPDHLGTVHDYIDNNGNFVERVGRNSFGLPVTDTAPSVDLLFGYWGRDWDPETQMTDARSRPLDHRTIKFVKEDDKGHGAGDPNLYRDVVNSPTHFTDPYGHQGRPVASPPAPRVYPSGAEIAEMVRDAGYVVEDGALVLRKPPALASMVPEPLSPRKHAELLKELFGGIGHAVADTVMGCVCPFSTHKISSMSVEELTAIIKEYRDGERYHPIFNPYVHSGIAREQYMREVLPGAMADGVLLGSLMLPFLRITSLSKPLLAQIASKLQGFVDDAAKLVDNGALMSTLTSREKFALYNHPELRELMRGKAIERIVSSTARL